MRCNEIGLENDGTHHSHSARPRRQVLYLLHQHTNVFVPRQCALSEDPQTAVRLAGWHPPLSGGVRQPERGSEIIASSNGEDTQEYLRPEGCVRQRLKRSVSSHRKQRTPAL